MKEKKPRILVVFYSMHGHIYRMAEAVAEGVREAGGEPILKQVAELVPEEFWDEEIRKAKETMKDVPVADPRNDLKGIDGLAVGTPTYFGNMCSQMSYFWGQTGGDWLNGTLVGKPAVVFTSAGAESGGHETTIVSVMLTLLHHGCVLVGLPYSGWGKGVSRGSPYGALAVTGRKDRRTPSADGLEVAKDLGKHLTTIAKKLSA